MEIARDLALPQNAAGGYGIRPYVNLKGSLYTREALRWAVGGGVLDAPYNLALPQNATGGYGIRPYGLLPIGLTKAHRKPDKPAAVPKKVCGGFCVQRGRSPPC